MKLLVFLLLVANLALAAYVYVRDRLPSPDAQLDRQQIHADQIRIVPARPAPPSAVAATPAPGLGVCLEWGSFGAAEVPKALAALGALGLGERVRKIDVAVSTSYWIYIPALKSKSDMDRKMNELKALGITEYSPILEAGRWHYAISLGIFRREDSAAKYLTLLRGKGVRSAQIGEREQRTIQTSFLIRDPTDAQSAQLANLKNDYSGSDLRVGDCPPS